MIKTQVYNLKGESVKEMDLNPELFEKKENTVLVAQAARVQLANARNSIAHTKTRGEVSGGGKKPYKQKGTGNARAGSTRSPLWTGGGITFGPRNVRNFSLRFPKRMTKNSLSILLSEKVNDKKLIVLDELVLPKISTSLFNKAMQKLPVEGKILLILPKNDINIELSAANLQYIKVIKTVNLNIIDLANYDYVLTTLEGLESIENIFNGIEDEPIVVKLKKAGKDQNDSR